jgi:hypothetical protein
MALLTDNGEFISLCGVIWMLLEMDGDSSSVDPSSYSCCS